MFRGEDLDTGNPTAVPITSSTARETVFHGIGIAFAGNMEPLCGRSYLDYHGIRQRLVFFQSDLSGPISPCLSPPP
jgi:hypothetical protein